MKIVKDLDFEAGETGPTSEIVGIRCDLCKEERDADKSEHTPRLDIDDGHTIHRADLCSSCLEEVRQVIGDRMMRMRPVTEWTRGGIRSWAYDRIDHETRTVLRSSGICDEGLWSRFS